MQATWLGAACVLLRSGADALLIDPCFTRPPLIRMLFGRLAPDVQAVRRGLQAAGAPAVRAVLVTHSHYDHSLDAPEAARQCGAALVGSPSTLNVGRGQGLPEARLIPLDVKAPMSFGALTLRVVPGLHNLPDLARGRIDHPLRIPAHALAFKEGGSFALWVSAESGSALVLGSAGFIAGSLEGLRADTALLSLGGLGLRSRAYHAAYFDATAGAVGAQRVIPTHYDDFTRPWGAPLRQIPGSATALRSLAEWCARRGVMLEAQPPASASAL